MIGLLGLLAVAAAAPSAPARLCVMRHAEAWKNLPDPPPERQGAAGDALTPAGAAQAAAAWPAAEPPPTWVWVSPLGRTRETAAALGRAPPARVEPSLRPIDGAVPWSTRAAAWAAGEDPAPAGGGETLADAARRVAALEAAAWAALRPGETGLWVTHGDIAALVVGGWEGTPLLARPGAIALAPAARRCRSAAPAAPGAAVR